MNIFQNIGAMRPQSTEFNLSHQRKFALNAGKMIPILNQEVLPSDRWQVSSSAMVRFQPLLSPLMHMVDVYVYHFFVPARLMQRRGNFEIFITGGKNGDGKNSAGESIEIPYAVFNTDSDFPDSAISLTYLHLDWTSQPQTVNEKLADFLGMQFGSVPLSDSQTFKINMQPFITYWRVWNEYFRDQNLHPDIVDKYPGIFDAAGGDITAAIYAAIQDEFLFFSVADVCWEKDYFTSALPFAQRGEPVMTPLQGVATVTYKDVALVTGGAAGTATQALGVRDGTNNINRSSDGTFDNPTGDTGIDNIELVELESGGFTINQLRLAARLQEWREKMARGGARYIEQIRSMFGVTSSDARLQRPEFLGGGKIPVSFSEVLQTSEDGSTPLANMAGHGVTAGNVANFRKFFEEHGLIQSYIFIRPKTAYQQGAPRLFWRRFDKLDWAWPPFAHLGEQEVLNGEIYYQGTTQDSLTFGYQSRYAEYKYIPSTVHGEFRTTLDFWHWGREFNQPPNLSDTFVTCDPSNRIFNVVDGNEQKMYAIVNNKIIARRPLPYFGTPSL